MNKLQAVEKLQSPEGMVRVEHTLLQHPDHRYCFFKMLNGNSYEGFKTGAYALIDLDAEAKDGDRVLVGDELHHSVMRLRKTETGWACVPFRKSSLTPWFVADPSEVVVGVVERFFEVD